MRAVQLPRTESSSITQSTTCAPTAVSFGYKCAPLLALPIGQLHSMLYATSPFLLTQSAQQTCTQTDVPALED